MRRKVVKQKRPEVATTFKCPLCDGICEVKMDKLQQTGTAECRICGESFQARITSLSHPIDVYYEWLDACEAAKEQ